MAATKKKAKKPNPFLAAKGKGAKATVADAPERKMPRAMPARMGEAKKADTAKGSIDDLAAKKRGKKKRPRNFGRS